MLDRLHLVRHGEVHNPDHLVYADLPGFGLSTTGARQAAATAARLAGEAIDALVSSPLERARATAAAIAAAIAVPVTIDDRLTEWRLAARWAGHRWADLPTLFPGELEAYLADPRRLPFSPEPIDEVAGRMTALVRDLGIRHPGGTAVVVSHQDPVQALRLDLRGEPLEALRIDPPGHACLITLDRADDAWCETGFWEPDAGTATMTAPAP